MTIITRLIACFLIACTCGSAALAKGAKPSPAQLQRRIAAWLEPRVSETEHDGQYMRQGCVDADLTQLPDWKGLPVKACTYHDKQVPDQPVTTTAYLLFPSAEQLAKWIVNACVDAKRSDLKTCTGRLTSRMWKASNAQFPVAGYVVEPAQSKGWKYPDDPYCFLFQGGVSVTTASYPDTTHATDGVCGPAAAAIEPVVKAFTYGRPVSATRQAYSRVDSQSDVGDDEARSPQWAAVVGKAFREAWSDERNILFKAAVSELSVCDGNIWTRAPLPDTCK